MPLTPLIFTPRMIQTKKVLTISSVEFIYVLRAIKQKAREEEKNFNVNEPDTIKQHSRQRPDGFKAFVCRAV